MDWLKKLGNMEAAMNAIRRLVEQERGDPDTLSELIAWLIDQKAWKSVDNLAKRFAAIRRRSLPSLLVGPGVCRARGQDGPSGRPTTRWACSPASSRTVEYNIIGAAQRLRDRGLIAWSAREIEYVIAKGGERGD